MSERILLVDDSPDVTRVCAQILATDSKRIHLFQTLHHVEAGFQAATNELMILHLNLGQRRAAPFPPEGAQRVIDIAAAHAGLPSPPARGRVIGMRPSTGA